VPNFFLGLENTCSLQIKKALHPAFNCHLHGTVPNPLFRCCRPKYRIVRDNSRPIVFRKGCHKRRVL